MAKKVLTEEEALENKNYNSIRIVKLWFFTELLGSCPADPEVYKQYIAANAIDSPTIQDELQMLPQDEVFEKGTTCFLVRQKGKDAGKPCISSYTILGFQKEKTKFLRQETGSGFDKFTNYKAKIDGNYAIDKPFITLHIPEGKSMGTCQRPLRAETAQGPRVALASSQSCPPGTYCEFTMNIFTKEFVKFAEACFDKGYWNGHGQWRSGGKGRFVYEMYTESGELIKGNTKEKVGCYSTDPKWDEKFAQFLEEYEL